MPVVVSSASVCRYSRSSSSASGFSSRQALRLRRIRWEPLASSSRRAFISSASGVIMILLSVARVSVVVFAAENSHQSERAVDDAGYRGGDGGEQSDHRRLEQGGWPVVTVPMLLSKI